MTRIDDTFKNKKAFIGFLTAGDPVKEKTIDYVLQLEKAGASLIEIGIPFSDPIAEGPTIQEANIRALANKIDTDQIFELVKEIRKVSNIPLCFMTYLNVCFHYGYDKFFSKCEEIGIDGIILPDLPYEEKNEVLEVSDKYNVQLISMIAPTSKDRVKMIAKEAKGFIYLVSSMGVTGTRSSFSNNLEEIVGEIKKVTDTPVAIGFGINTPEQVKHFSKFGDGVIVGSAIVNIIKEYGNEADKPLYDYVKSLTDAL
ncbi:MAG: tryptophan synthase subunit alpha [Thomasclavelia sp.]|jgi:tryptophan synthase alpha chain|nr:tryptophan synthase subunit alpha [Thomasclavelia sp.]